MFCNELIINAYLGYIETDEYWDNADYFLDCYHDLALHLTPGYRVILVTDHYFISLSSDGAELIDKTGEVEQIRKEHETIDPFIWVDADPPQFDYEATLFIGERLIKVEQNNNIYLLEFDDFSLKIIPHELGSDDVSGFRFMDEGTFHHVYGAERLIKRRCLCGGTGELLIDFIGDYVVRCKKCKKSTYAKISAIEAIEKWEANGLYCDLSDIEFA